MTACHGLSTRKQQPCPAALQNRPPLRRLTARTHVLCRSVDGATGQFQQFPVAEAERQRNTSFDGSAVARDESGAKHGDGGGGRGGSVYSLFTYFGNTDGLFQFVAPVRCSIPATGSSASHAQSHTTTRTLSIVDNKKGVRQRGGCK